MIPTRVKHWWFTDRNRCVRVKNWCALSKIDAIEPKLGGNDCIMVITRSTASRPSKTQLKLTQTVKSSKQKLTNRRDLGIILDSKLTFKPDMEDNIDRANWAQGLIFKMTKDFDDIMCIKTRRDSQVSFIAGLVVETIDAPSFFTQITLFRSSFSITAT